MRAAATEARRESKSTADSRRLGLPSSVGEHAALAYQESLRRAFARAASSAGTFEQDLRIGDVGIRLRFAGQGLPDVFMPPLSPVLSSNGASIDIEVELWDEASTGVGIPEPVWRPRDVVVRGEVRGLPVARVRAQVDSDSGTLTMWDVEARRGIVWAADARRLEYWVRAAPLRSILHWGVAGPRRHLLHAAAMGDEHAGALLVGSGGSGKSTTALACLADGVGFIADDCVLVEIEPSPRALSVYGTARLNPSSLKLLPKLPALQLAPDAPKSVIDVAGARPDLMRRSAAVSAILLPQVTPGPLALRPVTAATALRALAPSTIVQQAHESATGMAVMAALVRRVPAYRLELGSDIAAVPVAIRDLLEARS